MNQPSARACAFCGATDLTREHVLPRWLASLATNAEKLTRHRFDAEVGNVQRDSREHVAPPFSLEVRKVCATCNHGWMSQLETRVRPLLTPMIEGRGRALHRDGQRLIAAWGLKTAMMVELTVPVDGRGIPTAHYKHLFDHGDPPPSTAVILAAYGGDTWTAYFRQHALLVGDGASEHNGYVVTLGVGQLVLQVFGTHDPGHTLGVPDAVAPYLSQVWPYSGSLTWTPRPALNDADLNAFADAIGGS